MKKPLQHAIFYILMLSLLSCRKEERELLQDSFVRNIPSEESDYASAGLVPLNDGTYIIVGYENYNGRFKSRNPGRIVKIDAKGNVIWNKSTTNSGKAVFKALPMAGNGFLTLGASDFRKKFLEICTYNGNGDSLNTYKVTLSRAAENYVPFDMIQLSNGNYALAGSNPLFDESFLIILGPQFDSLSSNKLTNTDPNYMYLEIRSLCETPDNGIAITFNSYIYTDIFDSMYINTGIIRTDLSGKERSFEMVADTSIWEVPSAISTYKDGICAITSSRPSLKRGDGTDINYTYNYNELGLSISGIVNINKFTPDGKFIGRTKIKDYPLNGYIRSLRKTPDGGFICCGTVNQNNVSNLVSDTKIYLLKLDANLEKQWSTVVNTTYKSFGVDAIQTPDGGYLVSAFQRSMDKQYSMMVIKTDANGIF